MGFLDWYSNAVNWINTHVPSFIVGGGAGLAGSAANDATAEQRDNTNIPSATAWGIGTLIVAGVVAYFLLRHK